MKPINFLQKWAYLGKNMKNLDDICEKIKLLYDNLDAQNYIEHLFLNTMFLLNTSNDNGSATELPSDEINPSLWLSPTNIYVKTVEYKHTNYLIINSGLYDKDYNCLYLIFKENKEEYSSPWILESLSSCIENSGAILREKDITLEKIDYFSRKEYIIFKKEYLRNWNNPKTSDINIDHIKDRTNRLVNVSNLGDKDAVDIICKGITESCLHADRNYKYAAPYVYFNQKDNVLERGFLLPIKHEEIIICVAAIKINERTKKNGTYKIYYNINTILTLKQARKDAALICFAEKNWLSEDI